MAKNDNAHSIRMVNSIKMNIGNEMSKQFEERYPDIEVSVKYGGQALYYYIVSVE